MLTSRYQDKNASNKSEKNSNRHVIHKCDQIRKLKQIMFKSPQKRVVHRTINKMVKQNLTRNEIWIQDRRYNIEYSQTTTK